MRHRGFYASLGIPMIALGCGTPQHAKRFIQEQYFDGEIYLDQSRAIYRALNVPMALGMVPATIRYLGEAKANGRVAGPTMGAYFSMGTTITIFEN